MISSLKPAPKTPAYHPKSFMKNVVDSMWNGLTSGHPLSAGPSAQNGGEFLFEGGEIKWCSRMVSSDLSPIWWCEGVREGGRCRIIVDER